MAALVQPGGGDAGLLKGGGDARGLLRGLKAEPRIPDAEAADVCGELRFAECTLAHGAGLNAGPCRIGASEAYRPGDALVDLKIIARFRTLLRLPSASLVRFSMKAP